MGFGSTVAVMLRRKTTVEFRPCLTKFLFCVKPIQNIQIWSLLCKVHQTEKIATLLSGENNIRKEIRPGSRLSTNNWRSTSAVLESSIETESQRLPNSPSNLECSTSYRPSYSNLFLFCLGRISVISRRHHYTPPFRFSTELTGALCLTLQQMQIYNHSTSFDLHLQ